MQSHRNPKNLWTWFNQSRFNWIGRTSDGVHRWIGAPKGPSERACKNLTRYGIVMGLVGLCATAIMALSPQTVPTLLWLALLGGIHGLVFSIMGRGLLKMQKRLARLKTTEQLAEEFDATPETVQRLAAARRIRARININNVNFYDPDEFIASRSLLRAASSPLMPHTLLRAAEPTTTQAASEILLRPGESPPHTLPPVQPLCHTAEKKTEETEAAMQSLRH
jgi:hypothetical protein